MPWTNILLRWKYSNMVHLRSFVYNRDLKITSWQRVNLSRQRNFLMKTRKFDYSPWRFFPLISFPNPLSSFPFYLFLIHFSDLNVDTVHLSWQVFTS